jgi:hypothetical protein
MYYSYIEIEYVATSFSPARMDLVVKLLMDGINGRHLRTALLMGGINGWRKLTALMDGIN